MQAKGCVEKPGIPCTDVSSPIPQCSGNSQIQPLIGHHAASTQPRGPRAHGQDPHCTQLHAVAKCSNNGSNYCNRSGSKGGADKA